MKPIRLELIDGAILVVYFAFVLGIGFVLKRHMRSSTDFFLSGRLIPTWVAGLAFRPPFSRFWIFGQIIGRPLFQTAPLVVTARPRLTSYSRATVAPGGLWT